MSASPTQIDDLVRENDYLRKRNAQLQTDVAELGSEVERLRQMLDRLHGRVAQRAANPLSGGQ